MRQPPLRTTGGPETGPVSRSRPVLGLPDYTADCFASGHGRIDPVIPTSL